MATRRAAIQVVTPCRWSAVATLYAFNSYHIAAITWLDCVIDRNYCGVL